MGETELDLVPLLDLVRGQTGISLHEYRPATLLRRVATRLAKVGCQDCRQYLRLLETDPSEADQLLSHLTIKVSRFFRDEAVFARLRDEVLPDLLARAAGSGELRIWSAGCGNGEEPYSLAILLHEMAARGPGMLPATIYGTDIDEAALAAAREGLYHEAAVEESPPDLVERYFAIRPGRFQPLYQLHDSIRQRVRFLRHDLLSESTCPDDRPFQLALCRNVLIYFERPGQQRVSDLLATSIVSGGYLCLGEAEQLPPGQARRFEIVDRRARLYRRK